MSSIASFYRFDTSKLSDLVAHAEIKVKRSLFKKTTIDDFDDYLTANAEDLGVFQGSGYIYASLLVYLEDEKGINLLNHGYDEIASAIYNKRESTLFIFTHDHRKQYLNQLEPSRYTVAEIQKFNKDFSDDGDEETAQLSLEAISLLHKHLQTLTTGEQVILLLIG